MRHLKLLQKAQIFFAKRFLRMMLFLVANILIHAAPTELKKVACGLSINVALLWSFRYRAAVAFSRTMRISPLRFCRLMCGTPGTASTAVSSVAGLVQLKV